MADLDLPEMEPLEDETVFWDTVFGTPAGCGMVRNLRSIQDVLNMRVTSKNFRQLALTCVNHMESETTVQVPLNLFTDYSQLKSVNNIFFTIFTEVDARAISTIPKLVKAYFLFRQDQLDLLNLFIQNLTSIATGIDPLTDQPYSDIREIAGMHLTIGFVTDDDNLESVVAISNKKALIPYSANVNSGAYRLLSAIGQSLVQRNEVLEVYDLRASNNVPVYNWGLDSAPGLNVHTNIEFTNGNLSGFVVLRYVRLDMINFLQQANLGLIYPDQPPSDQNKPLKTYIPLTMSGIAAVHTLNKLLHIYVYDMERLFDPGNKQIFHFDELMRQYLGQYVAEINVGRAAENHPLLLMNITRYINLVAVANQSVVKNISQIEYKDAAQMGKSLDAISRHTIIPLQESDIVRNTLTIYNQLRRARSPYYLEDGTTAQW